MMLANVAQGAQQAIEAGGDVTCKWIIVGLVTAVVAMAGYIVKQHLREAAIYREWLGSLREQSEIANLVDAASRSRGGGKEA